MSFHTKAAFPSALVRSCVGSKMQGAGLRLRARLLVHQRVANDERISLGQKLGRIPGNPALPLPALVLSTLTNLSGLGAEMFDWVCRDAPVEPGTFQRGSTLLTRCFYHTLAGCAHTTDSAQAS